MNVTTNNVASTMPFASFMSIFPTHPRTPFNGQVKPTWGDDATTPTHKQKSVHASSDICCKNKIAKIKQTITLPGIGCTKRIKKIKIKKRLCGYICSKCHTYAMSKAIISHIAKQANTTYSTATLHERNGANTQQERSKKFNNNNAETVFSIKHLFPCESHDAVTQRSGHNGNVPLKLCNWVSFRGCEEKKEKQRGREKE